MFPEFLSRVPSEGRATRAFACTRRRLVLGVAAATVCVAGAVLGGEVRVQSVTVDGRAMERSAIEAGRSDGLKLPAGSHRISFRIGPVDDTAGGLRLRHRLQGIEGGWQESGGEMRLSLLALSATGDVVGLFESPMRGESEGWSRTLVDSPFVQRRESVPLPAGVRSLRIVFSSGTWDARDGASHEALGVAALDDCRMWMTNAAGARVELLPNVGFEEGVDLDGPGATPMGLVRGGLGPRIAQVVQVHEDGRGHVLALVDDNPRSGGEWRGEVILPEELKGGGPLWMEWKEAFSVGAAGGRQVDYEWVPPGDYVFGVQGLTPLGERVDAETVMVVRVPQLWWRSPAAWIPGLAVLGAGLAAAVRGLTRRRMRRELTRLEQEGALERERARIARDLHDDLGTSLTQITHLSRSVVGAVPAGSPAAAELDQIQRTSQAMTRALEEIVWAVDPRHDSLDGIANYVAGFAQEFLGPTGISCRLNLPVDLPAQPVPAEVRHHLFLAFKEAINNAVRHSGAKCVTVSLEVDAGGFILGVRDDGKGWSEPPMPVKAEPRHRGGRGVPNLRERLGRIGGQVEIKGSPGEGTVVRMRVPLSADGRRLPGREGRNS